MSTSAFIQTSSRLLGAWAVVLGMVAVLASASRATAGPLPEHWVADGCDWVVHVDAERLREAEALQPIFDALVSSAWGATLSDMGIDARMDLTDITMFGTITRGPDAKGQTTTMLQGGSALRDAIQQHVADHDGFPLLLRPARKTDGRGISAWTIESLSVHVALVPVGSPGSGELVAVLSDHSDRLQACIDLVIRGSREEPPSPEKADEVASAGDESPPGCVIVVRANDLDCAHPPLSSALLASASAIHGYLGYRQEADRTVVFARLRVDGGEQADGDRMVVSLNNMVEFWTHGARRMAAEAPALQAMVDLVGSGTVSRDGRTVELAMQNAIAAPSAPPEPEEDDGEERLAGVSDEPEGSMPNDR